MLEKTLALIDIGKLTNFAWFFGCMVLGIAAIAGTIRVVLAGYER